MLGWRSEFGGAGRSSGAAEVTPAGHGRGAVSIDSKIRNNYNIMLGGINFVAVRGGRKGEPVGLSAADNPGELLNTPSLSALFPPSGQGGGQLAVTQESPSYRHRPLVGGTCALPL
jgi:hypothetical protein